MVVLSVSRGFVCFLCLVCFLSFFVVFRVLPRSLHWFESFASLPDQNHAIDTIMQPFAGLLVLFCLPVAIRSGVLSSCDPSTECFCVDNEDCVISNMDWWDYDFSTLHCPQTSGNCRVECEGYEDCHQTEVHAYILCFVGFVCVLCY